MKLEMCQLLSVWITMYVYICFLLCRYIPGINISEINTEYQIDEIQYTINIRYYKKILESFLAQSK